MGIMEIPPWRRSDDDGNNVIVVDTDHGGCTALKAHDPFEPLPDVLKEVFLF
jgi:hypothetical protein